LNIDPRTFVVRTLPSIVYGGINRNFYHATKTENYLLGKAINDQNVLNIAFETLNSELEPNSSPVLASPDYRRSLALSLFYKFILHVNQARVNPKFVSAMDSVIDTRPLSSGQQSFPTDESLFPVSKPMTKVNAYLQASGEAQYTYDRFAVRNQLEAVFIQSTVSACRIDTIDTTEALNMPGVVKILFSKDIPGINTFTPPPRQPEILFCEDYVDYAGQPIGLVIARSLVEAQNAAKAVKVTYKQRSKPLLTLHDAIQAGNLFPKVYPDFVYGNAEDAINKAPKTLEGELTLDTQFHFFMEQHVAVCEPTEDGFDIEASSQWGTLAQDAIALALGKTRNTINVRVKQVGGGYGGKLTRANITAVASAVASSAVNQPVRVALDLNTTMLIHGKRSPWYLL
jgi:xanthine dehydrogenase/oxidase